MLPSTRLLRALHYSQLGVVQHAHAQLTQLTQHAHAHCQSSDDPRKQYDQQKIEQLVPDYDDIRDNNDVQHTPNVMEETGTLAEEYNKGGMGGVASALGGDVAGAAAIAGQMSAGAAEGTVKVAKEVCCVWVALTHGVSTFASTHISTTHHHTTRHHHTG